MPEEGTSLLYRMAERAAQHCVPLLVTCELTYRCNLSCRHCYVDTGAADELTAGAWGEIFGQLAEAGALYLTLTGGEILLRSDFLQIAAAARAAGFSLSLLTNGTLLTPDMADAIAGLRPMAVGLSLYGANEETHDGITGRHGSLAATLKGAELLRAAKVPVVLQGLVMDANVGEAGAMHDLAARLGLPLRLSSYILPAKSCGLAPQQYEAGIDDMRRLVDPSWLRIAPGDGEPVRPCKAGKAVCSISPEGDVFPCLLMPLRIGNLRQAAFRDIWSAEPVAGLQDLRSLTLAEMWGECRGCNLARYCVHCPGVTLSETGRLGLRTPSACRDAARRRALFEGGGLQ